MRTHEQPYMCIIKSIYAALIMRRWASTQKPEKHSKQSKVLKHDF